MSAGHDSIRRREYGRKNRAATPSLRMSMSDQVAKTANRAEDSYLQRRLLAYSKEFRTSQNEIKKNIGSSRDLDKNLTRTKYGQPLGSHVAYLGLTKTGNVSNNAPVSLYYDRPRTAQPRSKSPISLRPLSNALTPSPNRGQNRVIPPQNLSPYSISTTSLQSKGPKPRPQSGQVVSERARSFYALTKK